MNTFQRLQNFFVCFSTVPTIDNHLTTISSEEDRNKIADKISNLEANGGTCLGIALQNGLQVLKVIAILSFLIAKYYEIAFQAYISHGDFPLNIYFKVINNKGTTGGVITFLTDGQEQCQNDIPGGITNPDLLQDVVDQKVRIVTIAFG